MREPLAQLRAQLAQAKVVKVEAERELDGQFVGGALGGYADLMLSRADGRQAVVDMSLGGNHRPGRWRRAGSLAAGSPERL